MFISKNTSPFFAESFVAMDKFGKKSLVTVIRATFNVNSDSSVKESEEQTPFVYTDIHYGDRGTTSVLHESDFVPMKPRAEVLLNANAVSPSRKPVTELEVGLRGPGLNKYAVVIGKRRWAKGFFRTRFTPPEPFLSLPLAWHLAFGGADTSDDDPRKHCCDVRNPIGIGFHVNRKTIDGVSLPCIENLKQRIVSWADRPEPIGFGSLSRFAKSRAQFAGTYDQHWMDEVLPFLPQDFDERYYQSAPKNQQLNYLKEGSVFQCLNMCEEGNFLVRLPVLNVSVKYLFDHKKLRKRINPDTLIIEPHNKRIILIGRSGVELPRKFTRLREVVVEPLRNEKRHYWPSSRKKDAPRSQDLV